MLSAAARSDCSFRGWCRLSPHSSLGGGLRWLWGVAWLGCCRSFLLSRSRSGSAFARRLARRLPLGPRRFLAWVVAPCGLRLDLDQGSIEKSVRPLNDNRTRGGLISAFNSACVYAARAGEIEPAPVLRHAAARTDWCLATRRPRHLRPSTVPCPHMQVVAESEHLRPSHRRHRQSAQSHRLANGLPSLGRVRGRRSHELFRERANPARPYMHARGCRSARPPCELVAKCHRRLLTIRSRQAMWSARCAARASQCHP
jgi:hypothetical protein